MRTRHLKIRSQKSEDEEDEVRDWGLSFFVPYVRQRWVDGVAVKLKRITSTYGGYETVRTGIWTKAL